MIEIRTLRLEEIEQWFDHCMYVFNNGEYSSGYRQYFMNHWYNDPWKDLDGILIAVEDGKILSTIRIFYRNIYILGEKVSMGGIGEVSTKPEYRGKGLSGSLLLAAVRKMEEQNIKVSMLGASLYGYYRKFGWEQCMMYSCVSDLGNQNELAYKIRDVNLTTDLEAIKFIYSQYSSRYNGPIVRDNDAYWQRWIETECKNFYVIENEHGEIVSYICVDVGNDYLEIKEFGALPGCEDIFDSLAAHMAAVMGKTGCEVRYKGIAKTGLKPKRVEEEPYMMFRLVTPFNIKGVRIETTQQIIDVVKGDNISTSHTDFLFWGADGF